MTHRLDHPLAEHWLAALRDERTNAGEFRRLIGRLAVALFVQATGDLPLVAGRVRTPIAEAEVHRLAQPPVLVPILRAGLGMAAGILGVLPEARVCHVGMRRNETTLAPETYYEPNTAGVAGYPAIVLDPMLSTGGTAVATLALVKTWEVAPVTLLCIIASRPGLERLVREHPDVTLLVAAVDERLDDQGYIVPGIGDAGDRQFGG